MNHTTRQTDTGLAPKYSRPAPVASYGHTVALLGIMAGAIAYSLMTAPAANPGGGPATGHASVIPSYLLSLAFDWGIFYFAWFGVQQAGGSLLSLGGRRWSGPRQILRNVAIALLFWIVWEAVAYLVSTLLASHSGKAPPPNSWTPPSGLVEVPLWIVVSASAGFCEELIFRGYLQRQFSALSGSVFVGVVAQAIVFGLIHPRGWRAVVLISILGLLYGLLAQWRQDLKPGILAHITSDLWEGWLKHLLNFP